MKTFTVTAQAEVEVPSKVTVVEAYDGSGVGLELTKNLELRPIVAFEDQDGKIYASDIQLRKLGIQVVSYTDNTGVVDEMFVG